LLRVAPAVLIIVVIFILLTVTPDGI
jgi:hypothetical protein